MLPINSTTPTTVIQPAAPAPVATPDVPPELDFLFRDKEMADAKISAREGEHIVRGSGLCVIKRLLYKNMNEGPTFVVVAKVLESADKAPARTGDPVIPANKPGATISWPQKTKKFKSAPGNVKGFVLALLGYSEAQVTGDQYMAALAQCVSDAQPARGMLIRWDTYDSIVRSGKNAGNVNCYPTWKHVPPAAGNDKDSIAKRRAELDISDPL